MQMRYRRPGGGHRKRPTTVRRRRRRRRHQQRRTVAAGVAPLHDAHPQVQRVVRTDAHLFRRSIQLELKLDCFFFLLLLFNNNQQKKKQSIVPNSHPTSQTRNGMLRSDVSDYGDGFKNRSIIDVID